MSIVKLHGEINWEAAAAQFRATGRACISPWLTEAGATALRDQLLTRTDWREVFNVGERVYEIDRPGQASLDQAARERIDVGIAAAARSGFQYRYESLRVPDDEQLRRQSAGLLEEFARLMSSGGVLGRLSEVIGSSDLDFADAQATLYRPGDFLTSHDDAVEGKGRRAAYVFSLSQRWRPEWGGLLLFHGSSGDIDGGLTPHFNTLNLFAVPQQHSVSQVANYVEQPRLSVTGWLRQVGDQPSGS